MKKSFGVLTLGLAFLALVSMSCGNKKKASCEAYKAEIQVVDQKSDLASN